MKKIFSVYIVLSMVFSLFTGITAEAKKGEVKLHPKIVFVKYNVLKNNIGQVQKIKVSWNNVKTKAKVEILNGKQKKVITLLSTKVTKKGSITLSWNGKKTLSDLYSVANGKYYIKFILGTKSVKKAFWVNNVLGQIKCSKITLSCPNTFKIGYDNTSPWGKEFWGTNGITNLNVANFGMLFTLDKIINDFEEFLKTSNKYDESSLQSTDVSLKDITMKKYTISPAKNATPALAGVAYFFSYGGSNYDIEFYYLSKDADTQKPIIEEIMNGITLF